MATVIDALIVELGLDPKKFTQGQKDALASFKKTQEEANSRAKAVEDKVQHTLQVISRLKSQTLGLVAAFLGGRGIKTFVEHITSADDATGRLARNFGVTVQGAVRWQKAVELAGGTAEGVANSIQQYSDALQAYKAGIGDIQFIGRLSQLANEGGTAIDKAKPVTEQFVAIAENLAKVAEKSGIVRANWFGRLLGLDPGLVNLLVQGNAKTREMLALADKTGRVTEENTDAARRYRQALTELDQSSSQLGRTLVTVLAPALSTIMSKFAELVQSWFPKTRTELDRLGAETHKNLRSRFGDPADVPIIGPFLKWLQEQSSVPGTGGAAAPGGLRLKSGANTGGANLGTLALAQALQGGIPGLKEFTSLNDAHHAGTGSKHAQGLALDFTLNDPSQSAAVAAQIRAKLAAMGVNGTVLDEYLNPSKGSTGGHIHVQFPDAAAANRYRELSTGAGAAPGLTDNRRSSSSNEVNIGQLTINTQATDAAGIARDIKPALERSRFALMANSGPA